MAESSFQAWWNSRKSNWYRAGVIDREVLKFGAVNCIRNGCITDLHDKGLPLAVTMRVARHKTPAVNLAYNRTLSFAGAKAIGDVVQGS